MLGCPVKTPHTKERLRTLFPTLRIGKIKIKTSKCKFIYPQIKYLGHIVNGKGTRPDPAKVAAIENLPTPETVKQLRSFIGMVGFYKKFVPKLSHKAKPLQDLICTGKVKSNWGPVHDLAFK